MEPRDAATVMLVRDAPPDSRAPESREEGDEPDDAPGIEVFMLRRNLASVFVAGAYVFPGGAVDDDDRSERTASLVDGLDDRTASKLLDRPDGGLGFWVAAIRESFEEAGVLLARDRTSGAPAPADLVDRLAPARARVAGGEESFAGLVAAHDLLLDASCLRVFGHWITPSPAPRRYDTWFFLAPAPHGHSYAHDDVETIASTWVRADDALARARRGELELIYPTYRSIEALTRFDSTAALLAAVDAAWGDPAGALAPVEAGSRAWQVRLPGDDVDLDARVADAVAHSTTSHPRAPRGRVQEAG